MKNSSVWLHVKDQFIHQFAKNYYWTYANFLPQEVVDQLLNWAKNIEKDGLFRPAAIGKGAHRHENEEIRTDKIHWIDDFSGVEGQIVQDIFSGLQGLAREAFFLPAKRFECHFAKYEPGSFYKLHQDRHVEKPGRLLTCVIYLGLDQPNQGGELILYDEELRQIRISPDPGRIVIFDSAIEHEVSRCKCNRWSLTGWIRSDIHPGIRL
ncbi:MAG: 2OG-Fe(II) oxygenase [Bdellovibrionales bacterium]